jgi:hypothetical protein
MCQQRAKMALVTDLGPKQDLNVIAEKTIRKRVQM